MTLLNVLLQIQATGAAAADTLNQVADSAIQAAPQTVEMSYWEMAKKGGPFIMIPMLIMSFIAVYIFIERWVAIKKASKEDTTFMDRIKDYIMDGKLDSATNLCQQANTPAARMIEKGISRLGKPMNDVLVAIENVGNMPTYLTARSLIWMTGVPTHETYHCHGRGYVFPVDTWHEYHFLLSKGSFTA